MIRKTRLLAAVFAFLTAGHALAIEWQAAPPKLFEGIGGDPRPAFHLVTEFHGQHRIYIDKAGLPYRAGTDIPYLFKPACSPLRKVGLGGDSCSLQTRTAFDGVVVERLGPEECLITETTIQELKISRDREQATVTPDALIRTWRQPCPVGLR